MPILMVVVGASPRLRRVGLVREWLMLRRNMNRRTQVVQPRIRMAGGCRADRDQRGCRREKDPGPDAADPTGGTGCDVLPCCDVLRFSHDSIVGRLPDCR